jgi:hypothetical protein
MVRDRDSADLLALEGSFYWMALRSDNVNNITSISLFFNFQKKIVDFFLIHDL